MIASIVTFFESRREVPSRRAASIASATIIEQTAAAGDASMEVDDSEDHLSGYSFK